MENRVPRVSAAAILAKAVGNFKTNSSMLGDQSALKVWHRLLQSINFVTKAHMQSLESELVDEARKAEGICYPERTHPALAQSKTKEGVTSEPQVCDVCCF